MTSATPDTTQKVYDDTLPDVQLVRAFTSGKVRDYVERLRGHDDEDFALYQRLAYFLPAVARTLDAYAGLVMTPEPVISDAPDALEPYLDDLTNDGEPFQRICFKTVSEVIETGRHCLVVDYPDVPGAEDLSRLDAERMSLRPYVRGYAWESIIAVRTDAKGGARVLSHLRLRETITEVGENEWDEIEVQQVRVMDLLKGVYRVRLFRKVEGKENEWEQFGPDRFPKMNGRPMDFIPAVIFGPGSLDPSQIERPPLHEMAEISRSHLNDSALRQWGLMWCGQPTLVLAGLTASDETSEVRLGSSQGLVLGEGGSAELLALGADGVGAIKESMEEKRRDMAAIGARILADESGAQIATETARIQRAGEHSVLAGIANTVADGMTQVLRWVAMWAGIGGEDAIAVTLNTDYLPKGLQPGELQEWLGALQAGTMPLPVVMEHLKSRGVIDPQMTEAEWNDGIDEGLVDRPEPVVGDGEDEEIGEAA